MAKMKIAAALDMVNGLAEHQPGNHKDKMKPTMAALQSEDHKILLDAIDKLRSKGVSQYVDLPQIVVCGDQSSGKSSVLQAVSNMSFPIKDNLCTRFATELVLRHIDSVVETCKITIQPGNDRTDEEMARLNEFQHTCPTKDISIEELVEIAKGRIGLDEHSKRFSSDVLRIEVTGPTQPNLTIVDLPGLFCAGNKDQTANDAGIVSKLVQSYMTNSLSIILAVVSAKSDFALQEVTQLARKIDPHGTRTIGLITKPDTLDVGSDSERAYLDLAQNRDVTFRLGWHVLRNRDYKSRDSTNEERDQAEVSFFSQGVWAAVARKNKGVAALRYRLSEILTNHILKELPVLLQSVETELKECSIELNKLGKPRSTISEQRSYLLQASYHFATIVKESTTGTYSNAFFGSPFEPGGETKRLRAVVQSILADFAAAMRVEGHAKRIVEKPGILNPREILRADYLKQVQSLMRTSKGCELPGTFNPVIIGVLFQQQSKPWQDILGRYSEKILDATNCTVDAVLGHVVDVNTTFRLWQELVTPGLEKLKDCLNNKVSEILASHVSGHPITYNHYLTENVQKAQKRRVKEKLMARLKTCSDAEGVLRPNMKVESLINSLVEPDTEADMEIFASSSATDVMEAYYKVALKGFPDRVSALGDAQIHCIAGESAEITEDRITLSAKKKVLEECLGELRRLVKHHQHQQRQNQRRLANPSTTAEHHNQTSKETTSFTPHQPMFGGKPTSSATPIAFGVTSTPATPNSLTGNFAPASGVSGNLPGKQLKASWGAGGSGTNSSS
ncbi:hypothetical protein E8E14_011359 [Neopestalotiopsis sp. 37M]|nr:hypothetical protein E8E14_011359 [Neopestalotiopsis sp. 37M]